MQQFSYIVHDETQCYLLKTRISIRIRTTVPIPMYIFVSFDFDLARVTRVEATYWIFQDVPADVCWLPHIFNVWHISFA